MSRSTRTFLAATGIAALLTVGLGACSATAPTDGGSTSGGGDGTVTLGIASSTQSFPYVVGIVDGMRAQAEALGIEVVVTDAQNDSNKQTSDIQDLIAQQVDGILLIPVDGVVGQNQVDTIVAAGIPVVAAGSQVGDAQTRAQDDVFPGLVALSIQNELEVGAQAAEVVMDALPDGGDIGVVLGAPGYAENTLRMEKFTTALEDSGKTYTVVASQPGGWVPDQAQSVCQNMLQSNPGIKLFYNLSDDMALGCSKALEAASSDATIVGVGGYTSVLDVMKAGDSNIFGTVCYSAAEMGANAVDALAAYIDGSNTETGQFIPYDTFPVTDANLADCKGAF